MDAADQCHSVGLLDDGHQHATLDLRRISLRPCDAICRRVRIVRERRVDAVDESATAQYPQLPADHERDVSVARGERCRRSYLRPSDAVARTPNVIRGITCGTAH